MGAHHDEPKLESEAKRRRREAYEAAIAAEIERAPPVSEAEYRRLCRVWPGLGAARREDGAVTPDEDEESRRVEEWLDQLVNADTPVVMHDGAPWRALVAAREGGASEDEVRAVVRTARVEGYSWVIVGAALGIGASQAEASFGSG